MKKTPAKKPIVALFDAVDAERENLGRATSVLGCLAAALEHHDNPHKGPYFPDVAELALKMVADSMDKLGIALDAVDLRERKKEHPATPSIEEGSQSSTDNNTTRDL